MIKCCLLFLMWLATHTVLLSQSLAVCKGVDRVSEIEQLYQSRHLAFSASLFTQDYDLKYHRLEWEVDPAIHHISGKITSYFEPIQENFKQINFDLAKNMTVNAIIFHDTLVSFVQADEDRLQIDLPRVIDQGVLDSISVEYEGSPMTSDFGSFVTSTHNDVPVLWTLSEPYGAKSWWPCKQDLTDKIDSVDIKVTTPRQYRVGSNGLLVDEIEIANGKTTYHWRHRYPIPAYLISLAVTNYVEFSDYVYLENGDSILILNYVYPESFEVAQSLLKSTIVQMELFCELVGMYPFAREKYGHAQFGFFGGMEHQTMSSMGFFFPQLQAHELAHQWFGDKVTCASWQDIWLNEGFATYLEALTLEFLSANPEEWINWKDFTMQLVTNEPGGSTWVDDTTDVARIFNYRLTYQKGAVILHMLRWILGDDQFFQALRNYLEDPHLAYGYATTTDLQQHFETVGGIDLKEFFADWYYGQGYPSYTIRFSTHTNAITISIEQVTSHNNVDFFEMPLPIRVMGQMQDTLLRLDHTFSGQTFEIDLDFTPSSIEFDPQRWILSRSNSVEQIVTHTQDLSKVESAVKVVPNPAKDIIQILFENAESFKAIRSIAIMDLNGKVIDRTEDIHRKVSYDVSSWPSGEYLIAFQYEYGHFTKPIIIQ